MSQTEFKYDIAFSFLGADEPLARELNTRLKDRVSTFIYSDAERQTRLAGRDGEEAFARVFGEEARTVAVLYRAGWGEKGFTAAEAAAIRNRAFDHSYEFTTFIPLDDPPAVPKWLPKNRIWFDMKKWGKDGAAAVLESRIREHDGEPTEASFEALAAQKVRAQREADERFAFLHRPDVFARASEEFERVFTEVRRACEGSSGLVSGPFRKDAWCWMDAEGPRRVTFSFESNPRTQDFACRLRVIDYDGTSRYDDGNYTTELHFDFGPDGDLGWRSGTDYGKGKFYTSAALVERFAKILIGKGPRRARLVW